MYSQEWTPRFALADELAAFPGAVHSTFGAATIIMVCFIHIMGVNRGDRQWAKTAKQVSSEFYDQVKSDLQKIQRLPPTLYSSAVRFFKLKYAAHESLLTSMGGIFERMFRAPVCGCYFCYYLFIHFQCCVN